MTDSVQLSEQIQLNLTSDSAHSIDTEIFQVPVGIVIFLSICYGAVSLLSVLGNASVLWVVASRRRMRTVTNYYIGNLALADIIIGLFAIPFQFQAALLQKWILPKFLCSFCPFVQVLSVNVSVFTLSAIAFDRYQAVFYPLSKRSASKRCAKLVILFIWFLGALAAVPYAMALRVTYVFDPETMEDTKPFCTNTKIPRNFWGMYRYGLAFLQYALPLCFICYAYGRMGLRLRGSNLEVKPRDEAVLKNKKKVIKMLSIVVAMFALCWLPFQAYNVLQQIIPKINEYKYINVIWFSAHWLAMSNSCCNPFIYAIYNDRFKSEFKSQCRCKKRQRSEGFDSDIVLYSMSLSQTRRSYVVDNVLGELERYLQSEQQHHVRSSTTQSSCDY